MFFAESGARNGQKFQFPLQVMGKIVWEMQLEPILGCQKLAFKGTKEQAEEQMEKLQKFYSSLEINVKLSLEEVI
jgi:hypothetical protein